MMNYFVMGLGAGLAIMTISALFSLGYLAVLNTKWGARMVTKFTAKYLNNFTEAAEELDL